MNGYFALIVGALLSYLIGSIPSAVWIGKKFHNTDVREHGSGNAGATNTFRVLGKRTGSIVLILDIFKGFIVTLLSNYFQPGSFDQEVQYKLLFGICAVLGHISPIYVGFRGGKGIATLLGLVIGLHPLMALICLLIFITTLLFSHYVSLSSMLATISFPITAIWGPVEHSVWLIAFGAAASIMVILTHRANIQRLINGNENETYLFQRK
jgi:glycerol-3-phosphate acyltransferase PlsY